MILSTPSRRATNKPTRQEQHALRLEYCIRGQHTLTATFRPSETVCTVCGVVFYCLSCFQHQKLTPALECAYPLPCAQHQEVRA